MLSDAKYIANMFREREFFYFECKKAIIYCLANNDYVYIFTLCTHDCSHVHVYIYLTVHCMPATVALNIYPIHDLQAEVLQQWLTLY